MKSGGEQGDPAAASGEDAASTARNARYGLWLFAAYVALYAGFMALSAFKPALMASTPFGGVNIAILYGFGLIVAALVLALVYMALARPRQHR